MDADAHSLREDLYRVIQHYAELAKLAKKGEVDPISQIGKIVKNTAPYLLLVVRDLLPTLEREEITYQEALYHLLKEARRFSDQQVLMDSRNEIQKIEERSRVFIYAVKWLDSAAHLRPGQQEIDGMARKLQELNEKYKNRYAPSDVDTASLIPCFFVRQDSESAETTLSRMADVVRRAILELHHLMVENEPAKSFFLFSRPTRIEIEGDIMLLAWFLFRYGHSVDRIASGYYKDLIAEFLNEKLLDRLLSTVKTLDTVQGVSNHLFVLSCIDFASFFELRADYADLNDSKEVSQRIKAIKAKNRRGLSLIKRLADLSKVYLDTSQGRLLQDFLLFRYYSSYGDYHGDHRLRDVRAAQAIKIYKPVVDRSVLEKKAEEDLKETGRCFSSKTRDEMSGLLKLIMDSLENPKKVVGKKVKVLGDISSGAMGKVSVGIFREKIVALKKVKQGVASTLGDPVSLLQYEASLHARVQTPEQHAGVVEYYGLVEQDGEKLLLNGYHPNDNLTQLVERNWLEKYKPPFSTESKISLATFEIIVNQLLECLKLFRAKGVVHRDLKTDNILYLVDEFENVNRIKVIDFGVALAVGPGALEDMFKGKVVGTFAYMAPEQAKGKSGFQSDLYSVGAIFTVLLTGKLPMVFPKAKTRQDLVRQIMRIEQEVRPKLTQLNPLLTKNTVLEHTAETVERMLDLDPLRRPTIEEMQEAFNGLFQHAANDKHKMSVYYHKV
ncbi:MAG TPA: protein kinase [Desulfomonilaceae bacterium]|nr:protein kinase [Desulfomonilaceae bacterium]